MTGCSLLCRFVKCMSTVCVSRDRVMMLYPSGCLNPITLHICLIMFTGRSSTVHCHSRVSVLMRARLTALPLVIQPPCDRLRYPVTSQLCGFYFLSDQAINTVHNAVRANASQTVRLMTQTSLHMLAWPQRKCCTQCAHWCICQSGSSF